MNNGKIDNQLNLALEISEEERARSLDLAVGYLPDIKSWELIVKYSGNLEHIAEELNAQITELLNTYAIIVIREDLIDRLSDYPEIEFIEKPKSMYYDVIAGISASCINPVRSAPYDLSGEGVLVAIIDSGIDYAHRDFRNEDGTTRIMYLWDQTGIQTGISLTQSDNRPFSAIGGIIYTAEDINLALQSNNRAEQLQIVSETDISGHGTHVAGIACGNGRASNGRNRGVATKSSLLVVKLSTSLNYSFPRTTQLMTAVDFAIRTAITERMPLVINISFGNTYGSHDGNTILERYLNDAAALWQTSIVTGSGNEAGERGHTSGRLTTRQESVEMAIGMGERSVNVQLWKNYYDDFTIEIVSPSGQRTEPLRQVQGKQQYRLGQTDIILFYGEPKPMNPAQEIFFDFLPVNTVLDSGVWEFILTPVNIVTGIFNFWLPTAGALSPGTGFLFPSVNTTLTIPSTASDLITVGAYDSNTDSYAYFSGRGFIRGNVVKPELVAPGVGINSASPGGGYAVRSGTSMAAPFVSGSAALLMEWGIVRGNDTYLYGEKLKAYLIRGARQLPGFSYFPNEQVGESVIIMTG